MSNTPRLIGYLLRYKWTFAVGFVFLVTTTVTTLIVPQVIKLGVDGIERGHSSSSDLLWLAGALLGLAVVRAIARFFYRVLLFGASRKIERDLRRDLYEHTIRLPIEFFGERRVGELMAISSNDIEAVRRMLGWGVLITFDTLILVVGTVYMMWNLSPEVTLYAVLPMPFVTVFFMFVGPHIKTRFRRVQESFAALTVDVEESITGVRVLKAYVQEDGRQKQFDSANRSYLSTNMKMVTLDGLFQGVMALLPSLSLAVILYFGAPQVMRGELTLGAFLAIILYAGEMRWPIRFFGAIFNMIQRGRASVARIWDIFGEKTEFGDEAAPANGKVESLIRICDLSFSYPGYSAQALNELTLDVAEGETIALMGRTGSGKSTIISLLLRLYDPPPGTVFLDGIDILDIPKDEVRALFATAPQDAFLFTDSIRGNISFTAEDPVDEELVRVAAAVHLHEDVMQMPDQYSTVVGERGVTLSGGQRQRASLARAFLAGREILLLDDPLSAVDTVTEVGILKSIDSERSDRTVLLVTNRVNAARMADRIVVLDGGRIIEQGTEEELLKAGGTYAEIYERQQLEASMDEVEQP